MDKMSPALSGEMAFLLISTGSQRALSVAGRSPCRNNQREEHKLFITDVAMHLDTEAFGPQEHIVKMGEKRRNVHYATRRWIY